MGIKTRHLYEMIPAEPQTEGQMFGTGYTITYPQENQVPVSVRPPPHPVPVQAADPMPHEYLICKPIMVDSGVLEVGKRKHRKKMYF